MSLAGKDGEYSNRLTMISSPSTYNYDASAYGDEDCLFLNVYTRTDKKKMPVFVWIRE